MISKNTIKALIVCIAIPAFAFSKIVVDGNNTIRLSLQARVYVRFIEEKYLRVICGIVGDREHIYREGNPILVESETRKIRPIYLSAIRNDRILEPVTGWITRRGNSQQYC